MSYDFDNETSLISLMPNTNNRMHKAETRIHEIVNEKELLAHKGGVSEPPLNFSANLRQFSEAAYTTRAAIVTAMSYPIVPNLPINLDLCIKS
ncbi:MAG TPA: hypothetical protein VJP79_00610 [Nitrososphaera sp.]|nr:hypothetical protein [Nitrososphaera sp.]